MFVIANKNSNIELNEKGIEIISNSKMTQRLEDETVNQWYDMKLDLYWLECGRLQKINSPKDEVWDELG